MSDKCPYCGKSLTPLTESERIAILEMEVRELRKQVAAQPVVQPIIIPQTPLRIPNYYPHIPDYSGITLDPPVI